MESQRKKIDPTAAEKLRRLYERDGLGQVEFAKSCGIPPSTFNAILGVKQKLNVANAVKVAKGAGVDVTWLLDDEADWPPPAEGKPGVKLTKDQQDILDLAKLVSAGDPTFAEAKRRLVQAGARPHEEVVTPWEPARGGDKAAEPRRKRNG